MMENKPDEPVDHLSQLPVLRLNLHELAREQRTEQGQLALRDLTRLLSALVAGHAAVQTGQVDWRVRGYTHAQPGGDVQPMIELKVSAVLPLLCQRCLQPALQRVQDKVLFRLVEQEPGLTQEELEAEDEALCVRVAVDIQAMVEDQMLLALPLVPMHEVCPQPIVVAGLEAQPVDLPARASPFAALASLKKGK
ncbi:MAG: YceD family protein [Thiomonas sp.]